MLFMLQLIALHHRYIIILRFNESPYGEDAVEKVKKLAEDVLPSIFLNFIIGATPLLFGGLYSDLYGLRSYTLPAAVGFFIEFLNCTVSFLYGILKESERISKLNQDGERSSLLGEKEKGMVNKSSSTASNLKIYSGPRIWIISIYEKIFSLTSISKTLIVIPFLLLLIIDYYYYY